MLTEYSEELQEKCDAITEEVAQDFAKKLKDVTPRSDYNGVHLADTVIVTYKQEREYGQVKKARYVSYEKWQISHLLEFGWIAKNGRKVTRTPFVRPLFDNNKEKYYRMYKEGLGK
jgi:chromosome segregation and condensation protein ScpB